MIEIIDKNKLFNSVIDTNESSVNFMITFIKLYKRNKKSIIQFVEDVL